eukprot:283281-Chlamydomonas_euryale.AAC.1
MERDCDQIQQEVQIRGKQCTLCDASSCEQQFGNLQTAFTEWKKVSGICAPQIWTYMPGHACMHARMQTSALICRNHCMLAGAGSNGCLSHVDPKGLRLRGLGTPPDNMTNTLMMDLCCNVELLREHSAEEGADTTSVTKGSPRGRVRQDGACIRWAWLPGSFCHASTSPLLLLAAKQ